MPATDFRLFLDGEPATVEQLDMVEQLTVEQEVDLAWEARAVFPVKTDEEGRWSGEEEPWMQSFARFRVEVRADGKTWVPLIDGPVVGRDTNRSPEPGRSTVTLIVHDDSALLNREDAVEVHEDTAPEDVARTLFEAVEEIAEVQVESPAQPAQAPPALVRRGTAMQFLRQMARQLEMHAYVLPGAAPGESVGCFKAFPRETGDLPQLVLLGAKRNIDEFHLSADEASPAEVEAYSLDVTDKAVSSTRSSWRDLELLGGEPPLEREDRTATRLAPPATGAAALEPARRAGALAERAARSREATATVSGECYAGVVTPYQVLTVAGVDARSGGRYLVRRVTHTITRSAYTQQLVLARDGRAAEESASDPVGGIF